MENRQLIVLGGGESGIGAAVLALQKGYVPFVSDSGTIADKYKDMLNSKSIEWEEGGHTADRILAGCEIVKSPGIPPTVPIIVEAHKRNIPIISEIEFASRYTNAKMICITGSNGKTTTTKLIYHIFREAGLNVGMAGNVGQSLALQIAEGKIYDYYVLELSSFQLEDMYRFHAHVAILLNITPDHLDRYNNEMQRYAEAKMRIAQNQTANDAIVYWSEDPLIVDALQHGNYPAAHFPFSLHRTDNAKAYVEDGKVKFTNIDLNIEQDQLALHGTHNLYNSMAAGIAASIAHIKKENIRAALATFQNSPHRLEPAGSVDGVEYINDSKATNVNACWYALDSIKRRIPEGSSSAGAGDDKFVVLILGGVDKGNDYAELDDLVRSKVKALIFLGTDNSKLHKHFDSFGIPTYDSKSMQDTVLTAHRLAKKGDTVLLSPCCASFDLFNDMADRGNQFKSAVKQLIPFN